MYLLLGIIFFAVGLGILFSPHTFFQLTESWKSDTSGEPSRVYLFSTRFGGVMFCLVGAAGIVVQFLE